MVKYDMKKVGLMLAEARNKAGYTQHDVSKMHGYSSPQFLSNIERGVSIAPVEVLAKLIRKYKSNPKSIYSAIVKSQEQELNNIFRARS